MKKRLHKQFIFFCMALALITVSGCAEQPFLNGTEHLVVSFERSGGLTGKTLAAQVDTDQLTPTDAQALRFMVRDADFFQLPPRIGDAMPHPDRFQYHLTVMEKAPAVQSHEVAVEEGQIPGSLRPLVHWLMDTARQKTGKGQ